jgi:steroid delta-isomerase-like uncharacterized protein
MAGENLKDLTRKMYREVLDQGNLDAIDIFIGEDMIEHEPLPPDIPPGREGFRAWAKMMKHAFPDAAFEVVDITADGDKVWVSTKMRGTQKGDLMGMPPTGKPVEVDGIDILRFSQGKIVEHWGVFDMMTMMQQLGVSQASGEQSR